MAASVKGPAEAKRQRVAKIMAGLRKEYRLIETALAHGNPLQLLIATILSAQCTDERVNKVTPALFKRYRVAKDFARADPAELERIIHSTGFYKAKARSIVGCCQGIVDRFGGTVPNRMEDLVTLPGVGRKTANVVLGACWGIPGVVVDTHVKRIGNLLKLTSHHDPEKIERDLMAILPEHDWYNFSTALILHGRAVCVARRPKCEVCVINRYCPSARCAPKQA
ncbi:MAG: endonuclease III [Deltaproteobacteria bacterium]|nr:endonuclease III [Deltaproteobacteria bacterium]